MYKVLRKMAVFMSLIVSIVCINQVCIRAADDPVRPQGWTEATHGKADGNYSVVFPDNKVHRMDIVISSQDFKTMENNLNTLNMMSTENPVYVPATVKFNNLTWWNVGLRYKGSSTLFTPKQSGKRKLPFRLNFDKFEDQYPEIKNQKFYGFKELVLNNNWYDPSFVRDKVFNDILREGGIPAVRCSFARVYVDTGSGPVYWGLYTMAEDPSDEMLKAQFENSKGNLYKGQQGTGADLTTFNQQGFEKKTNEDNNDWSDLQALVSKLNASRADAASWRAGLESVFDVNRFLRWLAINTAAVNFDTYGWVTKNYYLYQDLSNGGRMMYIPCDFNMSLNSNPFGGGGFGFPGMPGMSIPASLSLSEIGKNWPLIRFLMDDSVYKNIYHNEMQAAMNGCFNQTKVTAKIRQYHELVRPYVVGAEGETSTYSYLTNGATEFNKAVTDLVNHVNTRHTAVRDYLKTVTITPIPQSPTPASTTPTVKKGDLSGDGQVNAGDYTLMRRLLLGIINISQVPGGKAAADMNDDQNVNAGDYTLLRREILKIG